MGELLNDLVHDCLNYKNGFYIEAGANDGIRQSNTLFLEKNLDWKGILIEPNFKKSEQSKKYRNSNNIFYNCALTNNENENFVIGNFDEDCSGLSLVATSCLNFPKYFSEEQIKDTIKEKGTRKQVKILGKTLNSILKENNIKYVDFLSLDVEGFELHILENFDFNNYKIKYILIETGEDKIYTDLVINFMQKNNYSLYEKISKRDHLFFLNDNKP